MPQLLVLLAHLHFLALPILVLPLHATDVSSDDAGHVKHALHSTQEKRSLKALAKSIQHRLTHKPANPRCETCLRAGMSHVSKIKGITTRRPTKFGDYFTCGRVTMAHVFTIRGVGCFPDMLNVYNEYTKCRCTTAVHSLNTFDSHNDINHNQARQEMDRCIPTISNPWIRHVKR